MFEDEKKQQNNERMCNESNLKDIMENTADDD